MVVATKMLVVPMTSRLWFFSCPHYCLSFVVQMNPCENHNAKYCWGLMSFGLSPTIYNVVVLHNHFMEKQSITLSKYRGFFEELCVALIKNCIKAPSEVLLWGFPHMFNTIWCSRKCPKLLTSRFKILTRIWTCQEKWNWLHGLNLSRKVNLASRIWICHNIMYLLVYTTSIKSWNCIFLML